MFFHYFSTGYYFYMPYTIFYSIFLTHHQFILILNSPFYSLFFFVLLCVFKFNRHERKDCYVWRNTVALV